VVSTNSSFVLRVVKYSTALPLDSTEVALGLGGSMRRPDGARRGRWAVAAARQMVSHGNG
jgi:hypothetical protein